MLGYVYSLLVRVLLSSIKEQSMKELSHVTNLKQSSFFSNSESAMKSFHISYKIIYTELMLYACHRIWPENSVGMAAFNRKVNYTNNLMKSTFKKGLITEIMQAITHEVIGKNEIVYINFLFLNLSNIFLILFTNFGHECILKLQR